MCDCWKKEEKLQKKRMFCVCLKKPAENCRVCLLKIEKREEREKRKRKERKIFKKENCTHTHNIKH